MAEFEKQTGKSVERILVPRSQVVPRKMSVLAPQSPLANPITTSSSETPRVDESHEETAPLKPRREDPEQRKLRTLSEMVKSERVYLNQLRSMKEIYLAGINKLAKEFKAKGQKIVAEEDIAAVFCNVEQLFALHLDMFQDFEAALEQYPNKSIGEIFLKRMSQFEGYFKYVSNFSQAIETLNQIKRTKAVSNLFKTSEKSDTTGMSLSSLISMPIKRMNQYEFWLDIIFESTPTTHRDFQAIQDAVEK